MSDVLKKLQVIPGIGKSLSRDLVDLGFRDVDELRSQNPREMYLKLCSLRGQYQDRCVLYVFRCAVYFAGNKTHDPDLLKWWNWQDTNLSNISEKDLSLIHAK